MDNNDNNNLGLFTVIRAVSTRPVPVVNSGNWIRTFRDKQYKVIIIIFVSH